MPKVSEDYQKKDKHLGLRFTSENMSAVEEAVKVSGKTKQDALEDVILRWVKRVLSHKRDK